MEKKGVSVKERSPKVGIDTSNVKAVQKRQAATETATQQIRNIIIVLCYVRNVSVVHRLRMVVWCLESGARTMSVM